MLEQHNQFERLNTLIGEDNLNKLKNKKVLIVGLGGVGGYVVESLSRSGVGSIVLVDYDKVDITNINRQIIALHSTIGMKKTTLFKSRILDINPNCNVVIHDTFLNKDNYLDILNDSYDFIIDCCDSINTKKLLLLYSINNNINYISSMGMANRMDPSKLELIDLNKTINDPIAKILRKYVRDNKINKKIMVLSSKELPQKNGTKLGSNAFVPATAGLLISSYVIETLIKA